LSRRLSNLIVEPIKEHLKLSTGTGTGLFCIFLKLCLCCSFLDALSKKWNTGTNPIAALEQEKKTHANNQGLQDITDFFVQVFVKAFYLKSQLHMEVPACLDYIRDKIEFNNKDFLLLVQNDAPPLSGLTTAAINLRGVLPPEAVSKLRNPIQPPPNFVLPLPPAVIQKMAAVALPAELPVAHVAPLPAKPEPIDFHSNIVKGEHVEFPNVPSVQVMTVDPNYRTRVIKDDPDAPPSSVRPPASVYNGASVRVVDSVLSCPSSSMQPSSRVGQGSKCLQFFYESPEDGEKIAFKPVYVDNDEEVHCVVALVAERAAEYQSKVGLRPRPFLYYSDAVRAKSRLDPDIVRYIERCFTKKGMKDHRTGFKKRVYPKRKETLIVKKTVKEESELEAQQAEEQEEEVKEKEEEEVEVDAPARVELAPPPKRRPARRAQTSKPFEKKIQMEERVEEDLDDEAAKRSLEELVFGGVMPKVRQKEKELAKPRSERKGRGGHNVRDEANPLDVLNAVGYMLNPEDEGVDSRFARQVKQSSLFKSRRKTRWVYRF
jgi:hypothetical protein